jgi:hypothetical protein
MDVVLPQDAHELLLDLINSVSDLLEAEEKAKLDGASGRCLSEECLHLCASPGWLGLPLAVSWLHRGVPASSLVWSVARLLTLQILARNSARLSASRRGGGATAAAARDAGGAAPAQEAASSGKPPIRTWVHDLFQVQMCFIEQKLHCILAAAGRGAASLLHCIAPEQNSSFVPWMSRHWQATP